MTCSATSRTSCSRQPPLTFPAVLPSSATASFAPSWRYAEPRTRTTVASAARLPAVRAAFRKSRTSRVSSHCFMQSLREMLERCDIGTRKELIRVRQRGDETLRRRLKPGRPGERIEPDQPSARASEHRHLAREPRRIVALPAVRHDDHDGATSYGATHPAAVEFMEARTDARPPTPVHHFPRYASERRVGIAHSQLARDAGQSRPEDEDLHGCPGARQGVREAQQEAAVPLHRARNVAYQDDRAGPGTALPKPPGQGLAARAERGPEHGPRGEPAPAAAQSRATRWAERQARTERRQHRRGVARLGGREPREVGDTERLVHARTDACRVVHDLRDVGARRRVGSEPRFSGWALALAQPRQRGGHRTAGGARAPEEIERRVVYGALFAPPHEHGPPRRFDVAPPVEAEQREHLGEAPDLRGVDGQAGAAQRAAEQDDVADQSVAGSSVARSHGFTARTSSSSFVAPPPRNAATSS